MQRWSAGLAKQVRPRATGRGSCIRGRVTMLLHHALVHTLLYLPDKLLCLITSLLVQVGPASCWRELLGCLAAWILAVLQVGFVLCTGSVVLVCWLLAFPPTLYCRTALQRQRPGHASLGACDAVL